MLISAMRRDDMIEICVMKGRSNTFSPSVIYTKNQKTNIDGLLNGNNNNTSITATTVSNNDQTDENSSGNSFNILINQQ